MANWGIGKNDPSQELLALREKVASKDTQLAGYQTQIARKDEQYSELKQLYDEVVNKLRDETEKALTLEKDLRQCTEDLRREKINVENVEASLVTAQQAAKTANMTTRELEATLDSLTLQSNSFQEQCQSLARDKARLEGHVQELQRLVSQSPSNSRSTRGTHKPRDSSLPDPRINSLESSVEEMRAELKRKDSELDTLTKKLATAQSEANRLSNEKNALERRTRTQISELQEALTEREEELAYLRDAEAGGNREEELMQRIEEDEAKIEALQAMLRHAHDAEQMEAKVKQTEAKLQEEIRRAKQLTQEHLQAQEEKEHLLMELSAARSELQALQAAKKGRPSLNPFDCDMEDLTKPLKGEDDATQPLPDEGTVEYVERLLSAIDRLRDERDGLRRDVHFLENESRFEIEALEAKLSKSMSASSTPGYDSPRAMNKTKKEMDGLRAQLKDAHAATDSQLWEKNREIRRLGQALEALGVVVAQSEARDMSMDATASADEARVQELQEKMEATALCLEETTIQRDELAEALRQKEFAWEEEIRSARMGHQEANRIIQDLQSEIDELHRTIDHLESERDSLTIHVKNVEADLERAQEELTTAESRYSDLQTHQLSSMTSSAATQALQKQIKELEGRIQRRNEQLGIHQHDIRRLETNLRLQEERLNEMTSELEMMSAEKAAMVEDCADAREGRDEALRKVEEMEEAMENMEQAVAEADEAAVSLVGVVFETAAKARQALRTRQSSNPNPDGLQEVVEGLKEDNAHLERSLDMYNERINQLTAQIVSLEGQHAATVAHSEAMKNDFHSQITALQTQLEDVTNTKTSMEHAHSEATRELEMELDRVRQRLREAEEDAARESSKDEDLALFHSRIAELQAALEDAECRQVAQLEELHNELQTLNTLKKEAEDQVAALQNQLDEQEAEHEQTSGVLQAELAKEKQNLKQLQQSFETAEQGRQKLVEELDRLQEALSRTKQELDAAKGRAAEAREGRNHEVEALTAQVNELTSRLEGVNGDHEVATRQHQTELATLREQHESEVTQLTEEIERVRQEISKAKEARSVVEKERADAEQQLTALTAQIEQNKSRQRDMESQIEDREHTIASLKADIADLQEKLNTTEQASAKATLNVSLLTAQHKRELADAQRELERLRGNGNLHQVIAELEERNQEMEQLLKQKCAEIEENDDRALEMLKENKKLTTKVETLTRKVQTLQGKMTTLKASSPKAESSTKASTTTGASSRPRSGTTFSSTVAAAQSQRGSVPSSSSRPLSRTGSTSAASLRPKTPERTRAPVFTSKAKESATSKASASSSARASTSPVGETEAVAGKKRRAPDDFEACDNVPPQAFTADSVPKPDSTDKTPRVRRALSTLQSGFTPVRTFTARPVAPLPSPKRNQNPSPPVQGLADMQNSPLHALPPMNLTFAPPESSGKASSKRSWLGKIRGQGTQGSSRPQ